MKHTQIQQRVDVVVAVIRQADRFLLTKRAMHKQTAPGYWFPVCGLVEAGERQNDALVREVKEEVMLNITAGRKVYESVAHDGSACLHWWTTHRCSGEARRATDEFSKIRWVRLEEMRDLDRIFPEDIQIFEHLARIFGWT